MNKDLIAPFTLEEVKSAAFQMGALKSPGRDGFPGLFYHKYWEVVNKVVFHNSRDFHSGGVSLQAEQTSHS